MYQQSEKNLLNSNTSSTCPDNMTSIVFLLQHSFMYHQVSES